MSFRNNIRKAYQLGPRKIGLSVEAFAELLWASRRVKRGGTRLTQLLQQPSADPGKLVARQKLERIAWAINAVAARLSRDPTCLMRALATQSMLRRRGITSCIRIGISEDSANFRAHAWVEAGGEPVVGWIAGERFTVLAQIK